MFKICKKTLEEIAPNLKDQIPSMQVAVYVMCGGGETGRMAAEQPASFYIDDRVGKLPYPDKQIIQAVKVLEIVARVNGLNPKSMPLMPKFHNFGVLD